MNCLRCGRKIEESASFCDECLKIVSVPLEDSPYLNTKIHLRRPKRTAPAPKVEADSATAAPSSSKGLVAAVIVLSIVSVLLAGCCLWLARHELYSLLLG